VVDVIADLILGNQISGRACEGWFIWENIGKELLEYRWRVVVDTPLRSLSARRSYLGPLDQVLEKDRVLKFFLSESMVVPRRGETLLTI
jgi:hypothetical protein